MPYQPRTIFNAMRDTDVSGQPPSSTGFEVAPLWSATESGNHLVVEVYSIEPGKESPTVYFPKHTELVVCWRGRGLVTVASPSSTSTPNAPQWDPPYQDGEIKDGDTIAIPQGALRRFRAADKIASTDPRDADKRLGKLVLIVIHALNGNPLPQQPPAGNFGGTSTKPFPAALKRNFRDEKYLKFDRNPKNRAVRSRVWGRDGEGDDGAADVAKASFHFTLYTFVPRQENPGHFHPHSIELIIAVQGRADTRVRDKKQNATDWDEESPYELREGDTLLVKEAGWHRYITSGNDDCLLLALQTPHPIMHTLKHETNF